MSHYGAIRPRSTITTVARYIYSDISACAIESMIGKWCERPSRLQGFSSFFKNRTHMDVKQMTEQCQSDVPSSIFQEHAHVLTASAPVSLYLAVPADHLWKGYTPL